MINFIFLFFFLLIAISAIVVLWSRNVLYSAFSLLVTFLGISALYVMAGADFVAVTQILIYVGGILVLLIFGVMLTNKGDRKTDDKNDILTESRNRFWGILVAMGLFTLLFYTFSGADFAGIHRQNFGDNEQSLSSVKGVGVQLMTEFVLPFEITGILLMVALIGSAYLASSRKSDD
ncbi:NADH dehydrogenase subunit J [Pseudarcicella hirudinis]|uniref:NADH-quinone oxidoreductase subunit J n=1 Tax=Pseudarcicella hirudinis TaxID=1079859 RepID=A0A1I5X1F0_9BACT|nr:NADH-quinone oxidoreductase subunit J [Pseudarcicella hirudinis]SFQ25730.1 NADH dehydrogenase subunit J [Pseudarcicella hirudinis]